MNSARNKELVPELYNTRAEDMWACIEKHVDFIDKSVLDVGCGQADLMVRAWMAGAKSVYGIDNSGITITDARNRTMPLVKEGARIFFMNKNIEHWNERWPGYHDVIICTSVLPYVVSPDRILQCIHRDSSVAIIECQYAGDGPGYEDIKDDHDMKNWLSEFEWETIKKIGFSVVKSRNKERSIWLCEK